VLPSKVAIEMTKSLRMRWILRLAATGAVAVSLPLAVASTVIHLDDHAAVQANGCVNGVTPWDPYVGNCALGPRPPKIRGSAPDASAIIACRHKPGCLATYINQP